MDPLRHLSPERLEALVEDIETLAGIPAPTFAEEPRIAWLERRLAGHGGGDLARDEVGNLIWRWGEGAPEVLLLAHVDTVFDERVELRSRRSDGWLHGPGVGDNAAAVATAIHAVQDLLATAGPRAGAVAFTVGEEGPGNLVGAKAACAALAPRVAIAVEGHGLEHLVIDAVGSVRARVSVSGPGGHSWEDRGRPSAVHALFAIGRSLLDVGTPEAPVNVGAVSGGGAVNAIARVAQLVVERRSLAEGDLDAFASALQSLRVDPPLRLDVELVGRRPAGRLAPDAPLARVVRGVRAELGLAPTTSAFSSDANAALARGIPALTLGCARGADMHATSERIEIASLALGYAQLRGVLQRLLV